MALRTAMTGQDGLAAAVGEPPALILLDNRLPDGIGMQVLRRLAGGLRSQPGLLGTAWPSGGGARAGNGAARRRPGSPPPSGP